MADARFTKGEWEAGITSDGALILRVLSGEPQSLYQRTHWLGDMESTDGEDHANAALLAIAPKLFERLDRLVVAYRELGHEVSDYMEHCVAEAEDVLKKAVEPAYEEIAL